MKKNALGSEAAFELAKMLEVNHTLQCLILRVRLKSAIYCTVVLNICEKGNYIKTDGMCELGKSLAKNAGLEVLDLAVTAPSYLFRQHITLSFLLYQLNAADAQVLSGIAQGLQENYTLQELALGVKFLFSQYYKLQASYNLPVH